MPRILFTSDMDIDPDGALDKLLKFAEGFEEEVFDLAEVAFRDLLPDHTREIQHIPPRRSWPGDYPEGRLEWTSEKQRRWYWANIGEPYQRTNTLVKHAIESVVRDTNKVEVQATFGRRELIYVLGPLYTNAESHMQRFHVITGWQPVAPKLDRHAETYYERFVRRYESWIAFGRT